MEKTVIYARYSSRKQTEQSIEGQLRDCREYAAKNNLEIIDNYIDRAVSGRSTDRPQFQKMISDSKHGLFDYVLVYKLDRFSRNRFDSAVFKRTLRDNGVRVLSAMENINDNPESVILEGVLESFAEYYSLDLAQKTNRGMRESALKGKSVGGMLPYGYKYVDKDVVVDLEKAEIVKWCFDQAQKHVSLTEIARSLNKKGLLNNRDNPFNSKYIKRMLSSTKYIGIATWNGIDIGDSFEPIIDNDVFQSLQSSKSSQHKKRTKKRVYLLLKKVHCGYCGSLLVSSAGSGRNKVYKYYTCPNPSCNKKNENKDYIEEYVLNETIKNILNENKINEIAKKVVSIRNKDAVFLKTKETEKQIKKTDKQIDKIVNAYLEEENKTIKSRLSKKVDVLSDLKDDLICDLANLKIQAIPITENDIKVWLSNFKNPTTEKSKQMIIDNLVNSIHVSDDKIMLYYNISNNSKNDIDLNSMVQVNGLFSSSGDPYGT